MKKITISSYIKKDSFLILLIVLLSIISSSFTVFAPRILGLATTTLADGIKNGIQGIDLNYIFKMIIIAIILYVLCFILRVIVTTVMNKFTQNLVYSIRNDVQKKISRMPICYFESRNDGEILSKIVNDVDVISVGLNSIIVSAGSAIVTIIGITIMMFHINFIMALIVLAIIPITFISLSFLMIKMKKSFDEQQSYLASANSNVVEYYTGIETIKSLVAEEKVLDKYDDINKAYTKASKLSIFYSLLVNPISFFITFLGYIVVIFAGAYFAFKGFIKVGDILTFANYTNNIISPIQQLGTVLASFKQMQVASKRVFDLLNEEEEVINEDAVNFEGLNDNISFSNISFGYDEKNIVIKDFNANIKKGTKVAIVGSTGAGKTTIIKLLLRYYDTNKGDILFDAKSIKDIDRKSLRKHFGIVLQESWLFNGSIYDNIRFGKENATLDEVKKATKLATADKFIDLLPSNYDFVIDEDANNLSEGQKQLIMIARAFLSDSEILILDEATSSVDTRTEVYVKKAMDELMKDKTTFVIAHRLSTIQNADIILVLKDGNIVEKGKHSELMEKKGYYNELYNTQFA